MRNNILPTNSNAFNIWSSCAYKIYGCPYRMSFTRKSNKKPNPETQQA
jgi:hypothetical protein